MAKKKSSGSVSRKEKERIAEAERKEAAKSNTVMYIGVAVVAVVAVAALVWFLFMQPSYEPSIGAMRQNLEDNHFTVTSVASSQLNGADSGITFSFTTDHGANVVIIYQFGSSEAAKTFADSVTLGSSKGLLRSGVFVLTADHAHSTAGVWTVDEDIVDLFEDLLNGRSVGHVH
jgi:succinate dehydrogenase hydrophobic anchor subunit